MSPSEPTPAPATTRLLRRSNAVKPKAPSPSRSYHRCATIQHLRHLGRLASILEGETLKSVKVGNAVQVNSGIQHPSSCVPRSEFVALPNPETPHPYFPAWDPRRKAVEGGEKYAPPNPETPHPYFPPWDPRRRKVDAESTSSVVQYDGAAASKPEQPRPETQRRPVETRSSSATHRNDAAAGPTPEQHHPLFPHPDPRRRRIETQLDIDLTLFPPSPTKPTEASTFDPNAVGPDWDDINAEQQRENADFLERLANWVPGRTCLDLPIVRYGVADVGREAWWGHGGREGEFRYQVVVIEPEHRLGWNMMTTAESEAVRKEREAWAAVDVEGAEVTVVEGGPWWKRVSWKCGIKKNRV